MTSALSATIIAVYRSDHIKCKARQVTLSVIWWLLKKLFSFIVVIDMTITSVQHFATQQGSQKNV